MAVHVVSHVIFSPCATTLSQIKLWSMGPGRVAVVSSRAPPCVPTVPLREGRSTEAERGHKPAPQPNPQPDAKDNAPTRDAAYDTVPFAASLIPPGACSLVTASSAHWLAASVHDLVWATVEPHTGRCGSHLPLHASIALRLAQLGSAWQPDGTGQVHVP